MSMGYSPAVSERYYPRTMFKRTFAAVLIPLLLAGCATPVERSEITPKLYPVAEKTVAMAVLEARPYVLSGDKQPKFEGIIRGGFGIPHTVYRPNRPEDERFVDLVAGMIKDGFTESNASITVVVMPLGTTAEDALRKMRATGAGRYVIVEVVESNWTINAHRERHEASRYKYDFAVYVASADLQVQSKRFTGLLEDELSTKYNVFDMHSISYRKVIESMFADPIIQRALQ